MLSGSKKSSENTDNAHEDMVINSFLLVVIEMELCSGTKKACEADEANPRSGWKHKAWGASPRFEFPITPGSPRSGRQRRWKAVARRHGLACCFLLRKPGACAPGFMLSSATRTAQAYINSPL